MQKTSSAGASFLLNTGASVPFLVNIVYSVRAKAERRAQVWQPCAAVAFSGKLAPAFGKGQAQEQLELCERTSVQGTCKSAGLDPDKTYPWQMAEYCTYAADMLYLCCTPIEV